MRFSTTMFIVAAVGCGGKDGGGNGGEDTALPPVVVELTNSAPAGDATVALSSDVIGAHRATNTLLSAAALVVAEPEVQTKLDYDNPAARGSLCWSVPAVTLTTFTIDYQYCQTSIDTSGSVIINDHPTGPVIFTFSFFTMGDRVLNGTIAFNKLGADPLSWVAYDTLQDSPLPTSRSPIGIDVGSDNYGITFDGGATMKPFVDEWRLWGVSSVGSATTVSTVLAGGDDPVALMSPVAPAGAPTSSFAWQQCRCPMSGDTSYAMSMNVSEVTVDLDALKVSDDGVDDPEITLDVDATVTGDALVTATGCGTYAVAFTPAEGDLSLRVDSNSITSEINAACTSLIIDDPRRCDALVAAASSFTDFEFTISASELEGLVQKGVDLEFDSSWCNY